MNTKKETHHALESLDSGSAREIEDALWWVQGRKSIIRRHLHRIRSRLGRISTIMDIGCGSGGNLDVLAEFGSVIGVEPSSILADRSRSRGVAIKIYESPAWQLDETRSVDLFTMFDVLEHIEHDSDFLAKLKESASDKHALLLSVPACPFLFGEHDELLSHYRRYSTKMLNDCLVRAGYKSISVSYYMFFPFPAALAMRLLDKIKFRFGFRRESVDLGAVSPVMNYLLGQVLKLESALSEFVRFPIGLWLFVIAEPNQQ